MLRVILTVNFSPWSAYSGGGQRSTHNLATALAGLGHDVTVVYTRPPWEEVAVPSGLPYAIRWAALASRRSRSGAILRPLTAITVAREVDRFLRSHDRERGPAIVHGNGEEAALVPRLRRRHRFGFVMTPRYPAFPIGMRDGAWRSTLGGLRYWVKGTRYAALGPALRGADRWCPTSRDSADATARVYELDPARCRVVPNGVSPAFFAVARDAAASRGPLLFFGRLAEQKGIMTLVDALPHLREPCPAVEIVGRGPMLGPMQRRLAELRLSDRVAIVPWLDAPALAERVAKAAIVVLPSREESFGNAMAEAMAAGAPLVTTTAGSIPELVVSGEHGLLVPPDDPVALALAIDRMRDDPALGEQLGRNARARARAHWTWESVARTFTAIYEEIAGD